MVFLHKFRFVLLPLLMVTMPVGCGDSSDEEDTSTNDTSTNNSSDDSSSGGDNDLRAKLAACPQLQASEDVLAANCLTGRYDGQDLGGSACSLTVNGGGSYSFESSRLNVPSNGSESVRSLFTHIESAGTTILNWTLIDAPAGESYKLQFIAQAGTGFEESKIEIQVHDERTEAPISVTCVVKL